MGVPPGVYNATGRTTRLADVVNTLVGLTAVPVEVERIERMRPADLPVIAGDPARLNAATGWERRSATQTLADALEVAREAVRVDRIRDERPRRR